MADEMNLRWRLAPAGVKIDKERGRENGEPGKLRCKERLFESMGKGLG